MAFLMAQSRRSTFTWTENPYEAVWDNLRILQQPLAMAAILTGVTGARGEGDRFEPELAKSRSQEISYLITQADEYFQAADAVTLVTKPLPLYYGILALTKALIVAWKRNVSLIDIKYHGLDTRPRSEDLKIYRESPEQWRLGDEYAIVNAGVFRHLAELLGSAEIAKGSLVRLDQLIKTDPEITVAYDRLNGFSSLTFPLYDQKEVKDPYSLLVHPTTKDKKDFEDLFGFMLADFTIEDTLLHDQALIVTSKAHVTSRPAYLGFQKPAAGGMFLIGPSLVDANGGKRFLARQLSDFAAVFILSDLVRYRPEFWVQVARGDERGNIGLVSLFLNACRRRFPLFALQALYNEKIEFGVQSRMG